MLVLVGIDSQFVGVEGFVVAITGKLFIKVINVGSDTFGNPIFQKGLQN